MAHEETIWVSGAMMDSSLIEGFVSDYDIDNPGKVFGSSKRNSDGEALSSDHFPKDIYWRYSDSLAKKLPDFCMAAGWVVSEAVADVLRQFDMGNGALYPVNVFQHDRETLVEGTYFFLNFGNTKESVLLDRSIGLRESPFQTGDQRLYFSGKLNDNDIAIRPTALTRPDIWLDSQVRNLFFISDRLATALKDVKLAKYFRLKKCNIVEDN